MLNEFQLIESLTKKIPRSQSVLTGIGDDAAVLRGNLVFATDTLVEDVDFLKKKIRPGLIGHKALAMNLSDLAAMGAEPLSFVVAIGRPKSYTDEWLRRFYQGMLGAAGKYKIACVGGDFSRAKTFFASIAVLGRCPGYAALKRSGARKGDWIGVTGTLGGSILGKHVRFEPRLKAGAFLAQKRLVRSMIDVSDGLYQDLSHILKASRVSAEIETGKVPVSKDACKLNRGSKRGALVSALSDGEDFELLFTASTKQVKQINRIWPKRFPRVKLSWIGKITSTKEKVRFLDRGRSVKFPELKKKGFVHF